jgi:hypothetical protein
MRGRGAALLSAVLCFCLSGCQTAQQKSEALVADRASQLKHLSTYKPTWCQVETELTEPARARYENMFPTESASDLSFVWRARESTCELSPLKPSAIAKSQQAFLETSLCLLMQVHFVNSPFDELAMSPSDIRPVEPFAHIRAGQNPDLGIFLPRDSVTVETRTKTRGILRAEYASRNGVMLPSRLEQSLPSTQFVIEEIDYDMSGPRPLLKSFWISIGAEKPLRHSQAVFRDCRPL